MNLSNFMPEAYCDVFNIKTLNEMQGLIAKQVLETDLNMVVAAPTGSGKTFIHELAIIRSLTNASKSNSVRYIIAVNKF